MWELIRQNKRKSFVLFSLMGTCLILLGYLIGEAVSPGLGVSGLILATVIWVVLSSVSYFSGDSIILNMSGAKEVTPQVHPRLFNVVEEMKIAAGLPVMPKVYIIDSSALNAFATGRKPEKSSLAITAGLLSKLDRDELQGVVAHEMSHILNRDILFVTFAGIMLGSITLISQIFFRGTLYSGGRISRVQDRRSSREGGGLPVMAIIALIFAVLAPIMAQLLYLAISRRREYLADASAVRLTRYPEGLAGALEKISQSTEDLAGVNKITAPLYIANPIKEKGMRLSDLTSTHPPISERIKILRALSRGADLADYQKAFGSVTRQKAPLIPSSELKKPAPVTVAAAREKAEMKPKISDRKGSAREVNDLMRAVNQYLFVSCACGLNVKLPPGFDKKEFACPRCKRILKVPIAEISAAAAIGKGLEESGGIPAGASGPLPKLTYRRKSDGWDSFACPCGKAFQLSPDFSEGNIKCDNCGRTIEIKKA
jgi:heat shock protein HtpX